MRGTGRVLMGLLALVFLASCATTAREPAAQGAMARIRAKRVLVVGTAASMPPLNMTTKRGEIIGLDIDLARTMAEALDVKLRLAAIPFAELLPALEAGRIDVIISGMTITPERSRRAAFVGPYFVSGKSFLSKATNLASVKGPSELDHPGVRLAALRDSTSQAFVEQNMPRARLVLIKTYDEGIEMVTRDQADAMIADFPVCVFSVFRYPDRGFYALVDPFTQEPLGIALPRRDPEFETWARQWLQDLESSGALARMRDRWFKDASWLRDLP
jgi:polar amino acid transport system substrate-binding protein